MGRRGLAYVEAEADRSVAFGRYRALLDEVVAEAARARSIVARDRDRGLFWVSLAALVWTHVAYPAVRRLLARAAAAAGRGRRLDAVGRP